MAHDAPRAKVEATRARGARIVTYDRFREDRVAVGKKLAEETGATLVPPYDHPWTIAGQGTAGKELLEEAPDLDAILVCCCGGRPTTGSSMCAKHFWPRIRLFGGGPVHADRLFLLVCPGTQS